MYGMLIDEAISLRSRGFAVVALGDFNAKVGQIPGLEENKPNLNTNSPLFLNFVKSLNLTILNTLPISQGLFSHFVERENTPYSESLLDYGLSDSSMSPFITSFIVDSDARIDCGTDHALLLATIECNSSHTTSHPRVSEVFSYKLPTDQNYGTFNQAFRSNPTLPDLESFSQLDTTEMAKVLTKVITDSCCKCFLPTSNVRPPKRRHWLPPIIVKHINARRMIHSKLVKLRKAKKSDTVSQNVISRVDVLLRLQ